MPFNIVRNDICKCKVDVLVNSANPKPIIGYGIDETIYKNAGPKLLEERKNIGDIQVGDVQKTSAYQLKHIKYIFHTVGPRWIDGNHQEIEHLESCYKKSLELAKQLECKSIAFPLISTGNYEFPKEIALEIAVKCIQDFLKNNELNIYLVVFDKTSFVLSKKIKNEIQSYIDDHYVFEIYEASRKEYKNLKRNSINNKYESSRYNIEDYCLDREVECASIEKASPRSLDDYLKRIESTFSECVMDWIISKDYIETDVYKRANIDRKLFSKIKNNKNYHPKKVTAIALAIGLKLNLDETKDLIRKAGYALSSSNVFDLIIEYYIRNENYDIFEINQTLFEYNQETIGV